VCDAAGLREQGCHDRHAERLSRSSARWPGPREAQRRLAHRLTRSTPRRDGTKSPWFRLAPAPAVWCSRSHNASVTNPCSAIERPHHTHTPRRTGQCGSPAHSPRPRPSSRPHPIQGLRGVRRVRDFTNLSHTRVGALRPVTSIAHADHHVGCPGVPRAPTSTPEKPWRRRPGQDQPSVWIEGRARFGAADCCLPRALDRALLRALESYPDLTVMTLGTQLLVLC
jgi:hypothetical protein